MHRGTRRTAWLPAVIGLAMLVGSTSCSDSAGPDSVDIRDFIAALESSSNVSANFVAGSPPAAGSGPVANVDGTSAMILGGSALRTVSSSSAFTRIIVAIDGVDGYWELTIASTTTQNIVLTLAQEIDDPSFTVRYAAGTSAAVGAFDAETVSIIQVGTGDVQVSVSWDTESDVDLHVVEPGGEEIYYGNSISASGGELDLDSNPGCFITGEENENITWANTAAPRGSYIVRVDYFDSCGVNATNYVVTIRVKGQSPVTVTGQFTGTGDGGGLGDGVQVATFTY